MEQPISVSQLFALIDIIKNEELYVPRMKELQAREDAITERIGIGRTLDQADALKQKYLDELKRIESIYTEKNNEITAREQRFKEERIKKQAEIDNRKAEASRLREIIEKDRMELRLAREQLTSDQAKFKELTQLYDVRLKKLIEREQEMEARYNQFKALLGK